MEFGIIAEGKGDCAVLQNILLGIFENLDEEDIRFLRPEFSLDNTDKSAYKNMSADQFSSWTLVKQDCENQTKFEAFLNSPIAGERYIIVQIDTAECEEKGYDVQRSDKKDGNYGKILRNEVILKINEWLNEKYENQIFYAITIEETEAWIHTLYENKDTSKPLNAKETFQKYLNKKRKADKKFNKRLQQLNNKSEFDKAEFLSKDFQKITTKKYKNTLKNNESLETFVFWLSSLSK